MPGAAALWRDFLLDKGPPGGGRSGLRGQIETDRE
jgi:hypothetical protein